VDVGHKHGASSKDLTVKIKRDKDLSSSVIEMANKGLPAATSRRQEPWCRLISQYSVVRLVSGTCYLQSLPVSDC
jgi:hypothetical protein